MYGLLVVGNRLLMAEAPAYIGVEPHPYWIGVLLFAFRYGVYAGGSSGIMAAGLYLGFAFFGIERYYFEELSFYLLPSLFILVGAFLGFGVERYRRTIEALKKELGFLTKQETSLKEELKTLGEINRGLEKRIVTKTASVITLYEGARELESENLEKLYPAILNFFSTTLEAEEAAIYLADQGGWRLEHSRGWGPSHQYPSFLKRNEGIIGRAGASNRVVSVRDFLLEGKPLTTLQSPGDALIAGPLRIGKEGDVVGVYAIEKLPFLKFTSATISLFGFLLDWASRSIERAYYLKDLKAKDILDAAFLVYAQRYFESRFHQEFLRSKHYYLPLTVGLVQVKGLEAASPKERDNILLIASGLLKACSREMDVVARYDQEDIVFAVLWITASLAQAQKIKDKILEAFRELNLTNNKGEPIGLKIGLATFTPSSLSAEDMFGVALKDLPRDE